MSATVIALSRMVAREESRTRSRMLAYANVGARIGRSATWVRRLLGQGIGRVDGIKDRIDDLLIRGIEADIARLEAELAVARRSGAHPASHRVGEIEGLLATARSLLIGGIP